MASSKPAILDVVVENETRNYSTNCGVYSDLDPSNSSLGQGQSSLDNSLVQSPSLESFSTIQDIENLSELNMDENTDLYVKIDNPQKHLETLETYITFRITTKVARIEYNESEYVVRRRYNDFIWLHQRLVDCHPFCIIPPLPGKHSLIGQLDRYSKDFILLRMKALNTFMLRIVKHPILNCNEYFKIFLTYKQADFSSYRKQHRGSSENRIRTLSHSTSTHNVLKNRHMEFDKTKHYLGVLQEKLSSVEKISSRINKERAEFILELNSFHPVFGVLAKTEPELHNVLQNTRNAVERNMMAQTVLVQDYSAIVGNPIREFLHYIDAVQESIKKRDVYQYAYENSLDELNKRHNEKDRLIASSQGSNHLASGGFSLWKQPSFDEKLEKLGVYIPQLLKKVEVNQDTLECANESLRSDLQHWQNEKQQCLKKILLDFVKKQIEYYQLTVNAWEHVTVDLYPQNVTVSK